MLSEDHNDNVSDENNCNNDAVAMDEDNRDDHDNVEMNTSDEAIVPPRRNMISLGQVGVAYDNTDMATTKTNNDSKDLADKTFKRVALASRNR
ncbi:hypothetical protein PsorP6_017253 [Peronosclerospora sorghi]|uniref:Uncharacterized protein n=1 Tax=Peronosclerospora sorghi TaxID=230839 RepID=A0ACC0WMP2_9STRA|nr:hypothetical protein PsorP6_017253 [Peronosclerospora sorghi]